jgi:hypothetical protein
MDRRKRPKQRLQPVKASLGRREPILKVKNVATGLKPRVLQPCHGVGKRRSRTRADLLRVRSTVCGLVEQGIAVPWAKARLNDRRYPFPGSRRNPCG